MIDWVRAYKHASMGPRARARGNRTPLWRGPRRGWCFNGATSARSWKWQARAKADIVTSCFNGATSARSWKCHFLAGQRVRNAWLQWGHERALVEIQHVVRHRVDARGASMGPRARARGNIRTSMPL